jgi:hypothetical protein
MAEIELNRLKGQCLDRRIPDGETLIQEVFAWTGARNGGQIRRALAVYLGGRTNENDGFTLHFRLDEALDRVSELVDASQAESGDIEYRASVSVRDESIIEFFERYEDMDALIAHSESAHFQDE